MTNPEPRRVKEWSGSEGGWTLNASERRNYERIRCSDCGQTCGYGQHPGLLFFCTPCGQRKGLS